MNDLVLAFEASYDGSWLPSDMLELYAPMECLADNNNCATLLLQSRYGKEKFIAKCYSRDGIEVSVAEDDIISTLSHESLPEYAGRYENEQTVCVVRRYAEGESLRSLLEENRFSREETADFALKVCGVLRFLHNRPMPVLHRDIKPENIIVDGEMIYLIDFGISRIVKDTDKKDTRIAATASYAPPEQFGFLPTDERSDIYALGVVMNEMITGSTDVRIDAPGGGIGRIIKKCTAFSPEDRYRNVSHLARDIRRWKHRHVRTAATVLLAVLLTALAAAAVILLAGYFAEQKDAEITAAPDHTEGEQLHLDGGTFTSSADDHSPAEQCELRISADGYYLDGEWFSEGSVEPERITSLVIEETVENINDIDLSKFVNLTQVFLPGTASGNMYSIAARHRNLETITVGAAPGTGIGWSYDFPTCTLRIFADGIGTGILEHDLYWNKVSRINTSAIRHVSVEEGIREIRFNVFWDYTSLESLSLPASLEMLDSSTFADNRSLNSVTVAEDNPWLCVIDGALYSRGTHGNPVYKLFFVPRNRTGTFTVQPGTVLIGKFSFEDCTQLEEVVLPSSLSTIDGSAFVNAQSLKRFVVPENSVFSFDEESGILMAVRNLIDRYGAPYTEAQIIFAVCSFRGHYKTPEEYDCVLLGDGAFEGCEGLTEVTIADNVLRIGAEAFMGCTSLETVHMPEDITRLYDRYAHPDTSYFDHASFRGSSVESMRIPYGVSYISDWAFFDCWNLREIYIPDTVTESESNAFDNCPRLEIKYYPD